MRRMVSCVVHVSLLAEEMKMKRKMARQMRREQRQLKREEHERLRQEIAAADGWQDAIGQLIEAFRWLFSSIFTCLYSLPFSRFNMLYNNHRLALVTAACK